MKKTLLLALTMFVLFNTVDAQNTSLKPPLNNDIISNYKHLSLQQLLDTADYFFEKRSSDTALICYNLLINAIAKDANFEQQQKIVVAYHRSAGLYYYMCDYRSAYDCLIKALRICEKINDVAFKSKIYTNIGNIYYRFKKYDIAKSYYTLSLNLCKDTTTIIAILNNLGAIELKNEEMDSAYYFFDKSLKISKRNNNHKLFDILNSLAMYYQKREWYDTALYYYKLSLDESKRNNKYESEAQNLSDLSKLLFEMNQLDSALFYIELSNTVAKEHNILRVLAENYLTLSKIEEKKKSVMKAFEYFKRHASLRDSVYNIEVFADINHLQRLYEVSKTNQQIEQLSIEQQINERTIQYQKLIQRIIFGVLLLMGIVLAFIVSQNQKLKTAYKVLVEKNVEIIKIEEKSTTKDKKNTIIQNDYDELMNKILTIMEDPAIYCDPLLTIGKLATLTQSHHNYVSQAIKSSFNKNFRTFVNGYRIKEAQRIFMDLDTKKYTIESVFEKVGFKSRSVFYDAFKEHTGVSPNYYIKSMQG